MLAKKLNLCRSMKKGTVLTMTGNQIDKSVGECESIPIEIVANIYLGNAYIKIDCT